MERLPLPAKIADAPQLALGLQLYLVAFFDLLGQRQFGMVAGPIPYLSIAEYCDRLGLDNECRDAVHHHVSHLDKVYSQYLERKRPKRPIGKGRRGGRSRSIRPEDEGAV